MIHVCRSDVLAHYPTPYRLRRLDVIILVCKSVVGRFIGKCVNAPIGSELYRKRQGGRCLACTQRRRARQSFTIHYLGGVWARGSADRVWLVTAGPPSSTYTTFTSPTRNSHQVCLKTPCGPQPRVSARRYMNGRHFEAGIGVFQPRGQRIRPILRTDYGLSGSMVSIRARTRTEPGPLHKTLTISDAYRGRPDTTTNKPPPEAGLFGIVLHSDTVLASLE